ncbi:hypothetical protein KL86PLE_41406 [uncultured Pleomorphomonas sp.]|uniref:Uncharacterized protein n=1 Tax=uncultured Pleomorphomonas sp. TaxID=442121 RepID=A0A212LJ72_9HYPH|nr:hypothetical protein KL86PLE_41406 [uncultured Pleomorphomonas sp.]
MPGSRSRLSTVKKKITNKLIGLLEQGSVSKQLQLAPQIRQASLSGLFWMPTIRRKRHATHRLAFTGSLWGHQTSSRCRFRLGISSSQ